MRNRIWVGALLVVLASCTKPGDTPPPAPPPPPPPPPVVTPPAIVDSVTGVAVLTQTWNPSYYVTLSFYNPDGTLRWKRTDLGRNLYADVIGAKGQLHTIINGTYYAVDMKTGRVTNIRTVGTAATPVYVDNAIYVACPYNMVSMNATTGIRNWELDGNDFMPIQPAADSSNVYIVCATPMGLYSIQAVDKVTTATKWKKQIGINPPTGLNVSKGVLSLVTGSKAFIGLNTATGDEVWRRTDEEYGKHYLKGDTLYSSAGGFSNRLLAIRASTGAELWKKIDMGGVGSLCRVGDDVLYMGEQALSAALFKVKGTDGSLMANYNFPRNYYLNQPDAGGDKICSLLEVNDTLRKLIYFNANTLAPVDSVNIIANFFKPWPYVMRKSQN